MMVKVFAIGFAFFPIIAGAALDKHTELRGSDGYLDLRNGTYQCESQSGKDDGLKKEKIPVTLYVEKNTQSNELFFTVNIENGIHMTSPMLNKAPSKETDFVVYSKVIDEKEKSVWALQSTTKNGVEGMIIKMGGDIQITMGISDCKLIRNLE
ncbi:hypothetical protein [Providencia manganoxydans]|uniref:hypothetical protein n=1 Tax=Providencia manganoxydans TaxID=2923283 RepID=UPI0029C04011|nr:hypothetical protein [Providencia manganoxydans]MDX4947152.1 hypothetical protein [Providencia manganoxydans]